MSPALQADSLLSEPPSAFFFSLMNNIGKDPDAGKDRGQEEKRATEDEMVGWLHRLNGQEFEQTLGDSEGQGSLVCRSLWVTNSQT